MKKALTILSLLIFSVQLQAADKEKSSNLPHCDVQAKQYAEQAHANKFRELCADSGCFARKPQYKGRVKKRVEIKEKKYLEVLKIKKYVVFVSDEVDGLKWLVEADAGNECKLVRTVNLGHF